MNKLTTFIATMLFLSLFLVASALAAVSGPMPWQFIVQQTLPAQCSANYGIVGINGTNHTTTCEFKGIWDSGFNLNMNNKNITNAQFINATFASAPTECILTNSFMTQWNFANSTCRGLNYSAFVSTTPSNNNLYDLGSALLRWANGYITNIFSTNITITGILNATNGRILLPTTQTASTPIVGSMYYNTTNQYPCFYNGSAWLQSNKSVC